MNVLIIVLVIVAVLAVVVLALAVRSCISCHVTCDAELLAE